jgi:hypothetical protein
MNVGGQACGADVAVVRGSDGRQTMSDNVPRFPSDAYAVRLGGGADVARSLRDRWLVDRMSA